MEYVQDGGKQNALSPNMQRDHYNSLQQLTTARKSNVTTSDPTSPPKSLRGLTLGKRFGKRNKNVTILVQEL